MGRRTIAVSLGIIAAGIAVLAALAPWLIRCTGPLRFVDCLKWEESQVPNAFAPWLFCPFGVCDYFPSTATVVLKFAVMAAVIVSVGVLVGRVSSRRPVLVGAAAAAATLIGFAVLTALLYERPSGL